VRSTRTLPSPTATIFPAWPPTASKREDVAVVSAIQPLFVHLSSVPLSPTAYTSAAPRPQTLWSVRPGSGIATCQEIPSKWSVIPPPPTAWTSFGPEPQRLWIVSPCGRGFSQHQRSGEQTGGPGSTPASAERSAPRSLRGPSPERSVAGPRSLAPPSPAGDEGA
jgi:hypothetical protein